VLPASAAGVGALFVAVRGAAISKLTQEGCHVCRSSVLDVGRLCEGSAAHKENEALSVSSAVAAGWRVVTCKTCASGNCRLSWQILERRYQILERRR